MIREREIWVLALVAGCLAAPPGDGVTRGNALPPPELHQKAPEVVFPEHLTRPPRDTEGEILELIARLWSPDFSTYADAARRLVAIGEPAVAYLGHFGDMEKEVSPGQRVAITRLVLEPILDGLPPANLGAALRSPYPVVRESAAAAAGRRRLSEQGPALLDLLEDEDLSVRRAANVSLRMLCNRFPDFRAEAPEAQRRAAAAKWRATWAEEMAQQAK